MSWKNYPKWHNIDESTKLIHWRIFKINLRNLHLKLTLHESTWNLKKHVLGHWSFRVKFCWNLLASSRNGENYRILTLESWQHRYKRRFHECIFIRSKWNWNCSFIIVLVYVISNLQSFMEDAANLGKLVPGDFLKLNFIMKQWSTKHNLSHDQWMK